MISRRSSLSRQMARYYSERWMKGMDLLSTLAAASGSSRPTGLVTPHLPLPRTVVLTSHPR